MIHCFDSKDTLREMLISGKMIDNRATNRTAVAVGIIGLLILGAGVALLATGKTDLFDDVTDLTGLDSNVHAFVIMGIGAAGTAIALIFLVVKVVSEKRRINELLQPPQGANVAFKELYNHLVQCCLNQNPDRQIDSFRSAFFVGEGLHVDRCPINSSILIALRSDPLPQIETREIASSTQNPIGTGFENVNQGQKLYIFQTRDLQNQPKHVFVLRADASGHVQKITQLVAQSAQNTIEYNSAERGNNDQKIDVWVNIQQARTMIEEQSSSE